MKLQTFGYQTLLLILIISLPAFSVMENAGDVFLSEFPRPDLLEIIGHPVYDEYENWQPAESDRLNWSGWQVYRYSSSGKVALAAGKPLPLFEKNGNVIDKEQIALSARDFCRRYAETFGMAGCDLKVAEVRPVKRLYIALLTPEVNGTPVYGGYVVLTLNQNAELTLVKARGFGSHLSGSFSIGGERSKFLASQAVGVKTGTSDVEPMWLPRQTPGGEVSLRACYLVTLKPDNPELRPSVFIDGESGEVVAAHNSVFYDELIGNTEGFYKPEFDRDEPVLGVFPHEWVQIERYGSEYSDGNGDFVWDIDPDDLPIDLTTELRGRWVDVDYEDGADASKTVEIDDMESVEVVWGVDDALDDERMLYYHTNFIHKFWKTLDPGFVGLDYPVHATCQVGHNFDNAFWNGEGMFFGGGDVMGNFAMYSEIIYHEYGHGVTQHIFPWGVLPYSGESGALNEAWSDYFPCSITDGPLVGDGGMMGGGYMRNLDNNLHYPQDIRGQVHYDGRIISGAMWHTREVLGREIADDVIHYARYGLGNDFLLHFTDILATDDDDGDITNGTPHYRTLYEQFGRHGIGPGIKPKIKIVFLEMFDDGRAGADGNDDRHWDPGETVRMAIHLQRIGTLFPPPAEDVTVTLRSENPFIEIERDEISFGDMYVDDLARGNEPLLFNISDDAPVSFAYLVLDIRSDDGNLVNSDTVRIPLGRPPLLLVRDGMEGRNYMDMYENSLDEMGLIYSNFDPPELLRQLGDWLHDFESVIWFTGDDRWMILDLIFSQPVLELFLDNGGNLLLTGQSAGEAVNSESFFRDYVGVEHVADSLNEHWVRGVAGDPVSRGDSLLLIGHGGARNQTRPGAVEIIDDETVGIFHWAGADGEPIAGIRREDPESEARVIYLAFGLEAVSGRGEFATMRQALEPMLNWFGIEEAVNGDPEAIPGKFILNSPYPNPFNGRIHIPFQIDRPGLVGMSAYDASGRLVWSGSKPFGAGKTMWSVDANDWVSGVYFIRIAAPGGEGVTRIVLMR